MNESDFLVLLCGKSGSGKTTLADALYERYGWNSVKSYTTRKPRYPDENGHIFISQEEVCLFNNDIVAHTVFDGQEYFATGKQLDTCNVYVIDPIGIKYLKSNYKGHKQLRSIYLNLPEDLLEYRMQTRGDSQDAIKCRIMHDRIAFSNIAGNIDLNLRITANSRNDIDYLTDLVYHWVSITAHKDSLNTLS